MDLSSSRGRNIRHAYHFSCIAMVAMGDKCARIAPCFNDSLIHDNSIQTRWYQCILYQRIIETLILWQMRQDINQPTRRCLRRACGCWYTIDMARSPDVISMPCCSLDSWCWDNENDNHYQGKSGQAWCTPGVAGGRGVKFLPSVTQNLTNFFKS